MSILSNFIRFYSHIKKVDAVRYVQKVTRKPDVYENHPAPVKNVTGLEFLTGNWRQDAAIFPTKNLSNRLLTIGIPTIRRENATYLSHTLESLFNCSTEEEHRDIYIVVFLADFSNEWKRNMTRELSMKYPGHIETGLLQVIKAPPQFYPPLTNLQHTYAGHSKEKRKWRAKQNFDYAYLFMYSKPLSTFYMQLEDDVYTVPGYLQRIRYNLLKRDNWVCLEFSELGYIGKAYHSKDLERLSKMILLFYVEQPGDFTYRHFNIMMLQFGRRIIYPTLFQHIGLQSSLPGKIQKLKDAHFETTEKQYKSENPPAKLFTSITEVSPDNPLINAYDRAARGLFWTTGVPKENDSITIVFDKPQSVDHVIIVTGSSSHPSDKLENGVLEASLSLTKNKNTKPMCGDNVFLGTFKDGLINATHLDANLSSNKVHCLRIIVTANQSYWLIVREIAVFTSKKPKNDEISPFLKGKDSNITLV
ncbi:Alpha-1,3-mannosyl-glycoprotein 4-beta-N-acetylglucosaminyltransferase C [Mizuhopecten yessoensis]|uniref:Alpha-1,3-mannosyl-glycoprotein 4-beta-N-acetylglucosaminyltransferase C n=1 Tax=Mizuhopecten yessoensis TaxID=6573 RepID=A0A210PW95_MIZYE|nr:Alpha-1,3-mannosyl-glycoprotein 4-beta-N-acetylglucosaminyltransferase C [Mizuhopecten yessoensis]